MAKHVCGTCAYCERPAIYNGSRADGPPVLLCNTHYCRMIRGIPLDAPLKGVYRDAWHRLTEAALRYADEASDNAEMALRTAAEAFRDRRVSP